MTEQNNKKLTEQQKDDLSFIGTIMLHRPLKISPFVLIGFNYDFEKTLLLEIYKTAWWSNGSREFVLKDKDIACFFGSVKKVERRKQELKNEGFITVVRKGMPSICYINFNPEKARQLELNSVEKYKNEILPAEDLISPIGQKE